MFCRSYFIFFITDKKPSITFTIKNMVQKYRYFFAVRQLNAYSDLLLTPQWHILENILSIISLIAKF